MNLRNIYLGLILLISANLYAAYPYPFQCAESEDSLGTTSIAFVTKDSLNLNPSTSTDYLIIASAELKGAATNRATRAQFTIGGTIYGETNWDPTDVNNWCSFTSHKVITLSASTDIKIQWATENSGAVASIRNTRILAIKLGGSGTYSSAISEAEATTPVSYADHCVLTFTPGTAGDYLLLATGEYQAGASPKIVYARWLIDGTSYDSSLYVSKANSDYHIFGFYKEVNLGAASHTITIQCKQTSGNGRMKNLRITALRLSDYYTYEATAESESEQSTTTTDFSAVAVTKTFTATATEYLVVGSAQIKMNNTSYMVRAKLQVDGTDYGTMRYVPTDATNNYHSFASLKQINLTAGSHTARIVYATTNSAGTAYIKSAYVQIIRKPEVTLSIAASPASWAIGMVNASTTLTSTSANKIGITNDGETAETFTLQVYDEDDRDEWTASSSESGAGANVYVFSGLFCATTDVPTGASFNEGTSDDVLTTTVQAATSEKYAYTAGTANGVNVPISGSRSLWFRFDSPTGVSGTYYDQQHSIIVRIGCQQ